MLIFKHRLFGINGVLWKFAREKIPDTMRKNLNGFGSVLRLTLNEIFCVFLFVSLTKSKGINGKNAITAAIMNQFDLKEGDKLDWELKADKKELIIVVRPVK